MRSSLRLPLKEGCRDVVAIADAVLDRISGRHPVAAIIENATHQERLRLLPGFGVIGPLLVELGLNGLEQRPIKDGWLFAREDLAFVADLANIEAVAQESGEGSASEWDAPMVRPLANGRTLV
jgi:hypothetical protein